MPRERFSGEQRITRLGEAEVLLAQGQRVWEICRQIGVSKQSYYRRRGSTAGLSWTRPGG